MTPANEIKSELERRNQQTRQKIKQDQNQQEFDNFMAELGIDQIGPKTPTRRQKR